MGARAIPSRISMAFRWEPEQKQGHREQRTNQLVEQELFPHILRNSVNSEVEPNRQLLKKGYITPLFRPQNGRHQNEAVHSIVNAEKYALSS